MVTYGTTLIPSDQIDVVGGSTVTVSAAFENSVGLVGGMDTANGSATAGEVVEVTGTSDAASKFGDGSELYEQVRLAFNNGAATVYALGVEETTVSAEVQTSQSGSLDNAPAFDPRVNKEHEITVTDDSTALDVNIVDEPPTTAPSSTDTVDVYPPTGEYYADAAPDVEYQFDYTYGDYSPSAVQPLLDESPRIVGVCTENGPVGTDVSSELGDYATNFDFQHAIVGSQVGISDYGSYSDNFDDRRLSAVYPPRGFADAAEDNEVRTIGAVAGYIASLPLGISSTNDSLSGLTGLKNEPSGPMDAGDLIDAEVMPLLDYPPVTIVSDQTTSTDARFSRVYAMQVIDEATEVSHLINRNFTGEQNVGAQRLALRRAHRNAYLDMRDGSPKMLDDFTVNVREDPNDEDAVLVKIGIDVVDVIDTIDVTITVGDVVRGNTQE